jgi:hypothetical protein
VVAQEFLCRRKWTGIREKLTCSLFAACTMCKIEAMKVLWMLRLVNLLAAILLPACSSANQAIPETDVPRIAITAPSIIETHSPGNGAFKTYHNPQAGFVTEYPADWTVAEQVGTDGSSMTTFSSADGSMGIMVLVQSGEVGGVGNSDLPNTRCEGVQVGELTGMRCLDTVNLVTSTTIVANGKTYTIASLGKHIEENVYNQFLLGFQIIQ